MTTDELLSILRRRWYVVVLSLVLLGGALAYVASRPGVYWAQVDVVVLSPKSARYPNVIEQSSESLIAMAGLIERDVNKGITAPPTSSSGVTLASEGVRDGHSIKLPNAGGQWANSFDRPVLDVQVVGSDQAEVRERLTHWVRVVEQDLKRRQDAEHIPQATRITASAAPSMAAVFYLGGSPKKALGATLVLGSGLVLLTTVGADRLLTTHARRRRKSVMIIRAKVSV